MVYITVVAVCALALTVVATTVWGPPPLGPLLVFVLLAAVHAVLPDAVVEERVRLSLSGVVLLAGQALTGPAGAGAVGLLLGIFQGRALPLRARIFNAAQFALQGALGGVAFLLAGGTTDAEQLNGVSDVVLRLALPLAAVDLAQAVTNLVLLAGVVRVSQSVPMRLQILSIARGTGPAYVGYGVIAFLMVVLWRPADLGPVAAAVVLAPLLVAQWAYRQHADAVEGRKRALEVLVAALEAKAPHLSGHSTRVAELSERMAEHLGLNPQQVADARTAGMLHDVGQTSLPTREVRALDLTDPGSESAYPSTGAAILEDLTFLRGALDPIRKHRESASADVPLTTRIVALADRYDLLTRVGGPGRPVHSPAEARKLLGVVDADLVHALDAAVARSRTPEPSA